MTHRLHIFTRRLARKAATLKAPARVMLCWLMVAALLGFTTNLCCCLMAMPSAGDVGNSDAIQQSSAMLMAAGDHSCCVKTNSDDQSSDNSSPAPHQTSSCTCQGNVLDAPAHSTTIHYSAVSSDFGVFALPRLTASWQLPAVADFSVTVDDASPPDTRLDTLVALACQLTV